MTHPLPYQSKFLLFGLAAALVSCASQTATPRTPTGTGNQNAIGTSVDAQIILGDAQGTQNTVGSIAASSGASVSVFQWAGVTCSTCQNYARSFLASQGQQVQSGRVLHFVVFDDVTSEWSASDFQRFLQTNSPSGRELHDNGGDVKRQLKVRYNQPLIGDVGLTLRPTLIVSRTGTVRVLWGDNANQLSQEVNNALATSP